MLQDRLREVPGEYSRVPAPSGRRANRKGRKQERQRQLREQQLEQLEQQELQRRTEIESYLKLRDEVARTGCAEDLNKIERHIEMLAAR